MSIRQSLKADLSAAIRAGDSEVVGVLRSVLAAIANAEAVELDPSHPKEVQGWAEVPRRRLSDADLRQIIGGEAEERRAAAAEYEEHGRPEEAARLRRGALLVSRYLGDSC